jgi:cytochrome P450
MEGAEHRVQRRILAPALTQQAIRNLAPIFFRKAEEIREHWKTAIGSPVKLEDDDQLPVPCSGARIDIADWISRGSFDVVGLAVLNYDFHSVRDDSEEVYSAYRRMFNIADKGLNLWGVLELYLPILRKIFVSKQLLGPSSDTKSMQVDDDIKVMNECLKTIAQAGTNIVRQKRTEYLESQEHGMESKDLLTLLSMFVTFTTRRHKSESVSQSSRTFPLNLPSE